MKRWLQTALIGLMAIGPLSVWSEVQHMKTRTIAYWIATVFVTLIMTASGVLAISHAPAFMKALSHL
jgi:hypothetical protein